MWTRILKQHGACSFAKAYKPPRFSSYARTKLTKVCIVGSGPAGFYTAQHILKNDPNIVVDMFEKLPVPFGLVRYGVAPDHPDVKNVINNFTNIAKSGRLNFFGNVSVGTDVKLSDLREAYNIVVLAYGAAQDRWLGIPGENLANVLSARKFVGWYNGYPEDRDLNLNLDVENAVIIGQGNVALDVARILLTPVDILKKTDIAQHALEALSKSQVKNVKIIGRRGPLQVAFTIKELREMIKLPGNSCKIHIENTAHIESLLPNISRPRKRLTELMLQAAKSSVDNPTWELVFCRSPLEISSANNSNSVSSVKLAVNTITEDVENPAVSDTGIRETVTCGLLLKSIGYKSVPLAEELPFDSNRGIIRQKKGRVEGLQGVYCSGWLSTGPVGVIANTLQSGSDVGHSIIEDLRLGLFSEMKMGQEKILPLLHSHGVEPITFSQWEMLDQEERKRGQMSQKPREKITDVHEMLNIVKKF